MTLSELRLLFTSQISSKAFSLESYFSRIGDFGAWNMLYWLFILLIVMMVTWSEVVGCNFWYMFFCPPTLSLSEGWWVIWRREERPGRLLSQQGVGLGFLTLSAMWNRGKDLIWFRFLTLVVLCSREVAGVMMAEVAGNWVLICFGSQTLSAMWSGGEAEHLLQQWRLGLESWYFWVSYIDGYVW